MSSMKAVTVNLRRIGNSLGIVIPKPLRAQVGLARPADLTVEHGALVLGRTREVARLGGA